MKSFDVLMISPLFIGFICILTCCINVDALANCPMSCKCDEDTLVVTCGEGDLDVLPIALNPSIKRLVIQKNKLKNVDSYLQFYSELIFLDLSYNQLHTIPIKTFLNQKKLQELHLNHNKIGSLPNFTFDGLIALTSLNLAENLIIELNRNCFAALKRLEELNLSKNHISSIDPAAFSGLDNLRVLYLQDNTLIDVPSETFLKIPTLAELYLGINSFATINDGAFKNLPKLSLLNLNGAAMINISLNAFDGIEGSLRQLDLSDNRLQQIPTNTLKKLTRLEELIIGQNEFDTIDANALIGLTNLRRLDVIGSLKLRIIKVNAFSSNTNLETLNLISNRYLSNIEIGAFTGLPHLKNCNLRENAFTTIPENLFKWNELEQFDFSKNPLHCDCRILWLRTLLNAQNSSQINSHDNVLCSTPDTVHEQPLKLLSPDVIGCTHEEARQQAIFGILLVGSVAIITAIALLLCRWHQLREAVKGRWGNTALGHKEREYQKTFSDEDCMHPNSFNACNFGLHQSGTTLTNYTQYPNQFSQSGLRPIPVTEL